MFKGFSKHWLANRSLHSRLLLYFILVSILPVCIIGVVSYSISVNVIKHKAIQFSEQMLFQVSGEIENLLNDTFKVAAMVANDPVIQSVLRKPLDNNIAERYSTDLTMDTRLHFIQSSFRQEFFGFYVIGNNGGSYKSNFYPIKSDSLISSDWYQQVISRKGPVWFHTHNGSYAVETIDERLISVGFPVIDKATGKKTGVVLIEIEEKTLAEIINANLVQSGYMFIIDGEGRVLSHPEIELMTEKVLIDTKTSEGEKVTVDVNQERLMISRSLEVTDWKIVGIIPVAELTKESNIVGYVIILSLLAITILASIVSWNISGTVANPINKLMKLMKRVEEGDLTARIKVRYNDEIGRLGRSFNVMVGKIGILMDEVYNEQRELRKAELRTLQAQINPHFLYNTLDSIIWLSRARRNDDVDKMATALTKLFRIGISRGRDIISIGEEVEHINSYLVIQNIRYKSKFTYSINVPEEIRKFQTLKLILQPLVENAIYHGIKEKRGMGHISITGEMDNECIQLKVKDTGIGMTEEKLSVLEGVVKNFADRKEKIEVYGVKNVDERIKIFFGPAYGLTFDSEYGKGTEVTVRIPKVLEVEGEGGNE